MKNSVFNRGTFTPPADLQPAVDSLTDRGREFLRDLVALNGGRLTHHLIAQAADYERGESKVQ